MNRLAVLLAALASAVALVGCGSGGNASPLDPARLAPANVPLYVSVIVRPRGGTEAAMDNAIAKLGLQDVAAPLGAGLNALLTKAGLSYPLDIAPWLGQRVLIALVDRPAQLSATDVEAALTVIGTTDDPAAARDFVREVQSASGDTVTGIVDRDYVAIGEPQAITALEHRKPGTSLATTAQYTTLIARLGGDPLLAAYVRPRPLARALLATYHSRTAAERALGPDVRSLLSIRRRARLALGVTVTSGDLQLHVTRTALSRTAAGAMMGGVLKLLAGSRLAGPLVNRIEQLTASAIPVLGELFAHPTRVDVLAKAF